MALFRSLAILALVATTAAGGAVELTKSNFNTELAGKNAFLKFFAPWCGT
jgi:hypothetical protein